MTTNDEEIIEELREHMIERGWSKPKATVQSRWWFEFIASRLRAQEPTEAPAEEKEATPLDVAGALSYLLTGHAASDKGPFAVHEADGFHDEPYVLLSVESMKKILDRLPESTW